MSCTKLSGLTKYCNSVTKDAHIHLLSCFINNHYGFRKLTFGHQANVTQKVRKSVYNSKRYFKQFFTFLERTSTFIISLFRANAEAVILTFLLKKAFCYMYVAYLHGNSHAELLHGCSPVNYLNIRRTPFLKTPLSDCFCIYESEYIICLRALTCS